MINLFRFVRGYSRNRHYRVTQFSIFILIWSLAFVLYEFFAPLYMESMELSPVMIGIILSGSSFISFFIDPFLGFLQKRFPPKTLLLSGIFLFFLTLVLFINSKNIFYLLFLATNLYGIAFDLFNITSYKAIFDNSVENDRSTNISFLESMHSVGLLVGAVVAGFVVSYNLKNAAYLCLGILFFLALIILATRDTKLEKPERMSFLRGYRDLAREMRVIGGRGIFLIFLLVYIHLFDGFFYLFEPIFAEKFSGYALNEYVIGGFLMAIYVLPIIVFAPYFGRLADKFGRQRSILGGLLMGALSIFLLQVSDSLLLSVLAVFLTGFSLYAVALPAAEGYYESVTEKRFGKRNDGCSVSVMEITLSAGFFFGPIIGGILISAPGGFDFAFNIFAYLTFVVFVLSLIFLKDGKKALF